MVNSQSAVCMFSCLDDVDEMADYVWKSFVLVADPIYFFVAYSICKLSYFAEEGQRYPGNTTWKWA